MLILLQSSKPCTQDRGAQVVFAGSAGEVHKQALDVMGHVEWATGPGWPAHHLQAKVILQADLLVPSDALLAASTRHGTHLAVVLTNEHLDWTMRLSSWDHGLLRQHLLDFEPALART